MTNMNEPLTHHERLRYRYLLKNLSYLNGKETSEFYYLQAKIDAYEAERAYQQSQSERTYPETSYSAYDDRAYEMPDYEQGYDSYSNQTRYTEQGLPIYSESPKARKPRPQRVRASRKPKQTSQNVSPTPRKAPRSPKPKKKGRSKRLFKRLGMLLALGIVLIFGFMIRSFFKGTNLSASGNDGKEYQPAVQEVFNGQDTKDGVNILVLGSDQRVTQDTTDARTDSILVVNVGNKDGKIKMVSFMRDTLVNIKGASYGDSSQDLKLNTAFNIGEQNNHRGAELMRETLKRNYDIDIKYYVMLDFETFATAIDTLFPEGVEIDAKFGTIDGQKVSSVEVPDDLKMDENGNVPNQTIKVGKQKMDGRTLLNYARFRKDDDGDYGRTQRQQQVLQAIVKQVKNPTKLFTGSEALGKVYALTSTNLSSTEIINLGLSNISSFGKGIESQTIPAEGDWVDTYDMYGGQALEVDFDKYKDELAKLGFR